MTDQRRMTRGEWEWIARRERMNDDEMKRVRALRGTDLIRYLVERLNKAGGDPLVVQLLIDWLARAERDPAISLAVDRGERGGITVLDFAADITLADGRTVRAMERVQPPEMLDLDGPWQEWFIPHLAGQLMGYLRTPVTEALMRLAADIDTKGTEA